MVDGCVHPEEKLSQTQLGKRCIHCGQLILRKMSKIGATRCQILRQKCTKLNFRWSSTPQTPLRELTALGAPTEPLAVFKGPTSKGRGGEEKGKEKGTRG